MIAQQYFTVSFLGAVVNRVCSEEDNRDPGESGNHDIVEKGAQEGGRGESCARQHAMDIGAVMMKRC